MDKNYIYIGDCINLLKNLPDNSIDLIIADPPYFEIKGEFDFIWKNVEDYIDWNKAWILECNRILKNTGSFYLWGAIGYNKGYALPRIAHWIESNNIFKVINWITQRNTRGYGTKKSYMTCREELIFMTHVNNSCYTWNGAYLNEKSARKDLGANGKPRKNEFKRCSDVWYDISEASQSSVQRFYLKNGTSFPTVKNIKLCDRIITASSNPNDLILIPFAGSGSEIISCIQNKRNFIASEINPQYVTEIILNNRLKNYNINLNIDNNIIKILI